MDRHDGIGRNLPDEDGPFPGKAFPLAHRRIVSGHDRSGSQDLFDGREDEIAAAVHAGGEELDRHRIAEAVHDESRQAVCFSVNDPVGDPTP